VRYTVRAGVYFGVSGSMAFMDQGDLIRQKFSAMFQEMMD
jgi:hypothetical protein